LDKLLKQTKKFLLYKIIPRAGFNLATGRFLPAGHILDTPALNEVLNHKHKEKYKTKAPRKSSLSKTFYNLS